MPSLKYTKQLIDIADNWVGNVDNAGAKSNRNTVQVQMYEDKFIENVFAKAHPVLPGVVFIPVILITAYMSVKAAGFVSALWQIPVGVLIWTFMEYIWHRAYLHKPVKKKGNKLPIYLFHGYHHDYPNDPMRLVAPLIASVPLSILWAVIFYFLFGKTNWWGFFSGLMLGYLAYDWIHYYTHHFVPKTRIGKYLRRYHLEHHYKDSRSHFGISSPLWDIILGTHKSKKES